MEKVILTKSAINRTLAMTRRLKRKKAEEQLYYLTIHLIRKNKDEEEIDLLNQVRKFRLPSSFFRLTRTHSNVMDFWTTEKLEVLLSNKRNLESYRKTAISRYDRDSDEPEIEVALDEELVEIIKWFRLC